MNALWGALAYEFRMQMRRPAVWLVVLATVAVVVGVTKMPLHHDPGDHTAAQTVADWAFMLQLLTPAGIGCLLADRLPRDRRLRVDELLTSMPVGMGERVLGKYLGSGAATLVPMLAAYAAGVLVLAFTFGAAVLGPALAAFGAVNLPGLLFAAAFSLGLPAVMAVPLYQFLFVGYWYWGNMLGPGFRIPTLSHTILTPVGGYALSSFFGVRGAVIGPGAPIWQGVASIAVLVFGAVLALGATAAYLSRQRATA